MVFKKRINRFFDSAGFGFSCLSIIIRRKKAKTFSKLKLKLKQFGGLGSSCPGRRASDTVKVESSRGNPRATVGLVSNFPYTRVNDDKATHD